MVDTDTSNYSGDYLYHSTIGNIGINRNGIDSGNPLPVYSDMNVYSAKIYNRALTEEEIKQNYKIDKKRFGI